MKIAYVTWKNPYDKKTWSGTDYFMINSLEKKYDVKTIRPEISKITWEIINIKKYMYRLLKKENYQFIYDIAMAKNFAKQIEKELKKEKYDLIFAPDSTALAFLKNDIPKIYLSDATFNLITNYYPNQLNNMKSGDIIEKKALENADAIIIPSKWAKENIVNHYKIKEEKVNIVSFGANLEKIPEKKEIRQDISDVLKLLFVGVDFERKGGDIAVKTLEILNNSGIKTNLTIIGCNPEIPKKENIVIIPYLNKHDKEDLKRMYDIYLNSDIFILPTRAECAGIVFSEASAFGLPIISTKTGGVPQAVVDGENGYCLNLEDKAEEYVEKIKLIISDKEEYLKMKIRTKDKFEKKLSWSNWLNEFDSIAEKIIKEKK